MLSAQPAKLNQFQFQKSGANNKIAGSVMPMLAFSSAGLKSENIIHECSSGEPDEVFREVSPNGQGVRSMSP